MPGQSIQEITPDVIIASATTDPTLNTYMHMGYSTKTGERLWAQSRTNLPPGFTTTSLPWGFATGIAAAGDGVYVLFTMATMQWWGYDVYTGNQIWGPTEPYTNAWGMYAWGLGSPALIAYGKLYAATFDGMVHCYNVKTGEHLWDYSSGNSGLETPYGIWPFTGGITVADGKIFAATSEHSPNVPLYRGEKLHVIDAETGKGVWTILGWWNGPGLGASVIGGPAVADGYLLGLNSGDGQIYCFGKGQTETTVSASPKIVAKGSAVLIEGTVTDQSPAQKGTPAIADESMTPWMEYMNMQKPQPTNAKGVPVMLQAMRSDGTVVDIATVTSDVMGHYEIKWTPPAEGTYKVLATFLGSESYWMSSAQTAVGVDLASSSQTSTSTSAPLDLYIIVATALIIIAIAIAVIILRRRK